MSNAIKQSILDILLVMGCILYFTWTCVQFTWKEIVGLFDFFVMCVVATLTELVANPVMYYWKKYK